MPVNMKKRNPMPFGSVRLANAASIVGVILYYGGRYAEAKTRLSEFTMLKAYILCVYGLALLLTLIMLLQFVRNNSEKILATIIPLILYAFHLTGSFHTGDFEFFFIVILAIFGICCLYQDFGASVLYLSLTTAINVSLFVFYFPNLNVSVTRVAYSSSHLTPSGILVIDAFIGFIASLALLVLTRVASQKSIEVYKDLLAFDTLLSSTPNYMVLIDDMKRVMYISESLARLAKAGSRAVTVGRPLFDLFGGRQLKLMFSDVIESGGFYDDTRELVIDGQTKYFKIIAAKLYGMVDGMSIDLTDVTPVFQSKLEADDARLAAEYANRAKSDFLARMSHEIRTPMNAIIGMGDLMRTDNLDKTQADYFNDIKRSSIVLMQIINDILDFSKIEAGKLDLLPGHFSLSALFDNMCSLNSFAAGVKDLDFRSELDARAPEFVYGDEIRIRQILSNLLSNAVKYTRAGYVSFKIRMAPQYGGHFIGFIVEDSGIGIRDEDMPRLFSSFEQIDKDRNRGIIGSGLGLSIAKRLTDLMGGKLTAESKYGEGSKFSVFLPLPPGDRNKIEKPPKILNLVAKPDTAVLVVDDNQINITVARAFLSMHGIDADVAATGYDAVEKAKKRDYDIVFMDYMLPDIDGFEATRLIRASDSLRLQSLPIIALTANAVLGERENFIAAGMSDYIAKPILADDMNRILHKWLPADRVLKYVDPARYDSSGEPRGAGWPAARDGAANREAGAINAARGLLYSAGSEMMYRQRLSDFSRYQRGAYRLIVSALSENDAPQAHRTAHTLKSHARMIGADALAEAAQTVEEGLAGAEQRCTDEQLFALRSELNAVLAEIGKMVSSGDETSLIKPGAKSQQGAQGTQYAPESGRAEELSPQNVKRARDMIEKLKPLLKSHRAAANDYTGQINDVLTPFGGAAMTLIRQIEDFDYKSAIATIGEIDTELAKMEAKISQ